MKQITPKKDGYYVARKVSMLSKKDLEVVQFRKGVVWRPGIQQGYSQDDFIFYKRVRLSEGLY